MHDLVVGSMVVLSDVPTQPLNKRPWRGHFVVVGVLCALSLAGVFYELSLTKEGLIGELTKTRAAIMELP